MGGLATAHRANLLPTASSWVCYSDRQASGTTTGNVYVADTNNNRIQKFTLSP